MGQKTFQVFVGLMVLLFGAQNALALDILPGDPTNHAFIKTTLSGSGEARRIGFSLCSDKTSPCTQIGMQSSYRVTELQHEHKIQIMKRNGKIIGYIVGGVVVAAGLTVGGLVLTGSAAVVGAVATATSLDGAGVLVIASPVVGSVGGFIAGSKLKKTLNPGENNAIAKLLSDPVLAGQDVYVSSVADARERLEDTLDQLDNPGKSPQVADGSVSSSKPGFFERASSELRNDVVPALRATATVPF